MSVQTTADKHVDKFRDLIGESFAQMSELLNRDMWGADCWDTWKILNTINKLQKLKDEWGIE